MKILSLLLVTLLMVGCGSGDDNDQQGNTAEILFNGLYQSENAVMLVDLDRQGQVIAYDSSDQIYSFDAVYTFSNELRLHGVRVTYDGGQDYFPDQVITVQFENNGVASAATIVDGKDFSHDFQRQPDTLALSEMLGTHTNPDTGETWAIYNDGSFDVNAYCTLSGQLTDDDSYYHSLLATASGCPEPDYDGEYQGMVFSVMLDGDKYLAGIVYNDMGNVMWGYVPLP